MEIEVKVQISSIEDWSVEWDDKEAAKDEMDILEQDIKMAIAESCALNGRDLVVKAKLIRKPKSRK